MVIIYSIYAVGAVITLGIYVYFIFFTNGGYEYKHEPAKHPKCMNGPEESTNNMRKYIGAAAGTAGLKIYGKLENRTSSIRKYINERADKYLNIFSLVLAVVLLSATWPVSWIVFMIAYPFLAKKH